MCHHSSLYIDEKGLMQNALEDLNPTNIFYSFLTNVASEKKKKEIAIPSPGSFTCS